MVLAFESVNQILKSGYSNESYRVVVSFAVAMRITLSKVVLTVESVNQILKCDHSNESY